MSTVAQLSSRELVRENRRTIRAGSRSFALASALFERKERQGAWGLYAWCRHCDDVVDGQVLGHGMAVETAGAAERVAELRRLTREAVETDATVPQVFQAFRETARAHRILPSQAMALLDGLEMDVQGRRYATLADTLDYAFHVAGVVGVMMAEVMGVRSARVLQWACDLGVAFQLTNIARDVVEDACNGRLYLPADWLAAEGVEPTAQAVADPANRAGVSRVAVRLLAEAETYYASARDGVSYLPLRSAWAIAAARDIYRDIGRVVRRRGERAWDRRAGVAGVRKLVLLARSYGVALAMRLPQPQRPREGLWTLPEAFIPPQDPLLIHHAR